MNARMKSPAMIVPEAMPALIALGNAAKKSPVPMNTLNLVYLRASQLNGCSLCCDLHSREARKLGETNERLDTIAAWREAQWFTSAERAALQLTEEVTRIGERGVTDETWNEATKHYDEAGLASLVLNIAVVNVWNRLNAATRQPPLR